MANLGGLKTLERLILDRTAVTDAGLVHLRKLGKLRTLAVERHRLLPWVSFNSRNTALSWNFPPLPNRSLRPPARQSIFWRSSSPARDGLAGTWRREEKTLVVSREGGGDALLQVPYVLPEEYDVLAVVERQGAMAASPWGWFVGANVEAVIDGWPWDGWLTGLHCLDGVGLECHKNKGAWQGQLLASGKAAEIRYSVRKAGKDYRVYVVCDGQEIVNWHGDAARLGLRPYGELPSPRRRPVRERLGRLAAHQQISGGCRFRSGAGVEV